MSWSEITLGDAIHIKHGFAFKSQFFTDDPTKQVVLTPGNFFEAGGFRARPDKDRRYDGEAPDGFVLSEGDLIVAMTEQGPGLLGSSALVPEGDRYLHNQRLGLIDRLDEELIDKQFLYYLFNTRQVRHQISASASGTKVRHTAPERIYRVRVRVPKVSTQKTVASVLAAYDDLIENNRRRIQLLEQAARLLFKEWFVHLRFPGREHMKVIDGVPEGWKEVPIKDEMEGLYDGPHATPAAADEGPVFLGIKNITPTGSLDLTSTRHISEQEFVRWTKRVTPTPGDIVFSYEATLNLYALIPEGFRGCLGRRLALIRPKLARRNRYYLLLSFLEARWRATIERNRLSGATVDRIPLAKFPEFPVLMPSSPLLEAFDEHVAPLFTQVETLTKQNRRLTSARDLLLPRLINGEIAV